VPLAYPSRHPLVAHKLAELRDERTGPTAFRQLVRSLTMLIAHEATADLPTRAAPLQTPLGPCEGAALADAIMIVPILRAGLGMADGLLELIPDAQVWHIGLFRDERTLAPTEYYNKLPAHCRKAIALVVDPMLATGGSAVRTCEILRSSGVDRIKILALIAAPEGIERLARAFPDVPVYVGAIDQRLTPVGFIYPGLGDAGDRLYGTAQGAEST
jgi:uracil phosphoribosyltransferase